MTRLVRADRKASVTQLTTRYSQDMQKSIFERATWWILKQMILKPFFGMKAWFYPVIFQVVKAAAGLIVCRIFS